MKTLICTLYSVLKGHLNKLVKEGATLAYIAVLIAKNMLLFMILL